MAACVFFVLLASGTLLYLNWLFRLKSVDGCYPAQMFYQQEENTVDVLCLGSSHTYSNINPAVLWDEYGMASYDFAGSNQPLWNTYYYLKEALKYQTPELIVLDVYRVAEFMDYQDDARVAMNTFGLRYSKDWKEMLYASLEEEDSYLDYLLRYPVYHARYQELKEKDFKAYNGDPNGAAYKGFNLNARSITEYEGFPYVSGIRDVGIMTDKNQEYLEKILKLAEEKEIPLLLIAAPYMGISEEEKMLYNQVAGIAKKYDVNFVDFNERFLDIGFRPERDFAESSHLNYYGSEKFSRYLGNYIIKHYKITDRRGDERFDTWEANSEFYKKHAANVDLAKTKDIGEYLAKMFANQDRYTICISKSGDYGRGGCDVDGLLQKYDLDPADTSTWIIQSGEVVYTLPEKITEESFYHENLGKKSITVVAGIRYSKMLEENYEYKEITLEGMGCDAVQNGINIMVYDNEFQEIVDNCGMDAAQENLIVRY